jgi:hypothetical protein
MRITRSAAFGNPAPHGESARFARLNLDQLLRGKPADVTRFQEAVMVQQVFDFLFVLALVAPPVVVIICAGLLAGASLRHRIAHPARVAAHA